MRNAGSALTSRAAASGGSCPTVLWIDDGADGDGLFRSLSLEGIRVTAATTGTQGLGHARVHPYNAIVVDLHLPDLHGFTVIQRLRTGGVTCPILAITGHYLDDDTPRHARAAGATAFAYKPMWADEVATLLQRLVNSSPVPSTPPPAADRTQAAGEDAGERVVACLIARLDLIVHTADQFSHDHARDTLLRMLLSALGNRDLPLAAVGTCAHTLRTVVTLQADSRPGELALRGRDRLRDPVRTARNVHHPMVRKAVTALLENPRWREEEDLARELGMSRGHFASLVHRELNIDYRTLRRLAVMKAGVREVLTSGEQVSQIAHRLGMLPGTFAAMFDEMMGCCPREFRRLSARLRS